MEKYCKKCNKTKSIAEFSKCKANEDGFNLYCKECRNKENKEFYILNREEILNKNKEYNLKNVDKRKEYSKKHYTKNIDKSKIYQKQYFLENIDVRKQKRKQYYQNNKQKLFDYNNKWNKNKREKDINFTIEKRLRDHFYRGIKFFQLTKKNKTLDYLGCSIEELLLYFNKIYNIKLTVDMIGKGKGKWSIDHKKSISNFDLTKEEDIKECFHYTNLQPMLFEENCQKRNKY